MYTAYYQVWYRHSGEEEIDKIPYFDIDDDEYKIVEDVGEITTYIGNNYITHMSIRYNIPPTLSTVAPQLTHLQIQYLSDNSQLERYVDEFNNITRKNVIVIVTRDNVMVLYLIVRGCIYNWRNIQ